MTAEDAWNQISQACEGKGGKKGTREPLPFVELLRAEDGLKVLKAKMKEPSGPHKKHPFYQAALEFVKSEEFRAEKSFAPFLDEVTDACGRWKSTGDAFWKLWLERCRTGGMWSNKAFAATIKEHFKNSGGQFFSEIKGFHELDDRSKASLLKSALQALELASTDADFCEKLKRAIDTIQQRLTPTKTTVTVDTPKPPPFQATPAVSDPSVTIQETATVDIPKPSSLPAPAAACNPSETIQETVLPPIATSLPEPEARISDESVTLAEVAAISPETQAGGDVTKGKKPAKIKPSTPPLADVSAMLAVGVRVADAVEKVVEKLGTLDAVPAVLRELTAKLADRDRLEAELAATKSQVQSLNSNFRSCEIRLAEEIAKGEDLGRQLELMTARIASAEVRAKAAEAAVASADDDIREIRFRAESAVQSFRASLSEALSREFVDIAAVPVDRERSAERADVFHRRLAAIRTLCRENGIDIPEPNRTP